MIKALAWTYLAGALATVTLSCAFMALRDVYTAAGAAIVFVVGNGLFIGLHALMSHLSKGKI